MASAEEKLKEDIVKYTAENIKGQREFIQTTCVISGALASFSLFIFSSPYVQAKNFLILAICLFLFVIGMGLFRLKVILENECKDLANIRKMVYAKDLAAISVHLNKQKDKEDKLDYTLDFLIYPLLGALVSIVLAFLCR